MPTPQSKNLENAFINDCLRELKNNPAVRLAINKLGLININEHDAITSKFYIHPNNDLHFFLSFLSCTLDGQAVMPFLSTETKEYKKLKNQVATLKFSTDRLSYKIAENKLENTPKTLQALLLQQFVDVCFNQGKGFDLALQHINQLYIDHIYV